MSFPVADWEVIPIDTYKSLLPEVKERFNAVTEETVSCTDKSIKCLFAFVTYIFGVGIFLLTNKYEMNPICYFIIIAFSGYNVFLGYRIIRLRPSHTTGLLPENVLSVDFNLNSGFTEDEKQRLFYYNAINTYSLKISEGTSDNAGRAKKYDTFFGFTLLLILIVTLFVFYTISYHPEFAKS